MTSNLPMMAAPLPCNRLPRGSNVQREMFRLPPSTRIGLKMCSPLKWIVGPPILTVKR